MAGILDSFLGSLGKGLQTAGGILSPQVYQDQVDANKQLMLIKQRQAEQTAQQIVGAIQDGSMPLEQGKQALAQLGPQFQALQGIGPSQQTQAQQQALQSNQAAMQWLQQGQGGQPQGPSGGLQPSAMSNIPPAILGTPAVQNWLKTQELQKKLERPQMPEGIRVDPKNVTPESWAKYVQSGRYQDLVFKTDSVDKPQSNIGKLAADLKAGRITPGEYKLELDKMTHITKVSVNAGEGGAKIPNGYRWADPSHTRLEPIPGGPAGELTDEGAKFAIRQAAAGDSSALVGFARSATMRAKIANLLPEVAKEMDMKPSDFARVKAEFQGYVQGERTLATRQANIELAANVVNQFVPIAQAASESYARSGIKSLNDLQKAVQSRTASPELRRLDASVNAVVNAYARAINPTGVGNEQDKAEARKILDSAFAKGDFKAASDQIMVEINAELRAPGEVKKGMRGFFKPEGAAPEAAMPQGWSVKEH